MASSEKESSRSSILIKQSPSSFSGHYHSLSHEEQSSLYLDHTNTLIPATTVNSTTTTATSSSNSSANVNTFDHSNDMPKIPRKDSHKEIERRRRENISDGIKQIADLLPQKQIRNKAHVLENGAKYIRELKEKERNYEIIIANLRSQLKNMVQVNAELAIKINRQSNTDLE